MALPMCYSFSHLFLTVWQKNYLWSIYFGSEMLIMIRVRALAYLLLALAECNEYQLYCTQANPKPNPLSITYGTQAFLSSLHYYFYA